MAKKYNPDKWREKRKKLGKEAQKQIDKILNKYYGDLEDMQEEEIQEMEANKMHHHPITSLTDTYDFFDNDFRKFVLAQWCNYGEFMIGEGIEDAVGGEKPTEDFDLNKTQH